MFGGTFFCYNCICFNIKKQNNTIEQLPSRFSDSLDKPNFKHYHWLEQIAKRFRPKSFFFSSSLLFYIRKEGRLRRYGRRPYRRSNVNLKISRGSSLWEGWIWPFPICQRVRKCAGYAFYRATLSHVQISRNRSDTGMEDRGASGTRGVLCEVCAKYFSV
ncbi:hypothetical protein TNCT_360441 [Trichonephila clavata]|uniref:Uncharacterized protein n=1 Tax=Trichonephila clavata TaxID=2740835 RepID=A0A8X6GA92_TRICU|nr:hypothetical protein TNCT_360441 [Trichonephila clavata]